MKTAAMPWKRNILTLLKDEVVMRQEATVITIGSDYKKLVNLVRLPDGWETDTRSQTATSRLELIEPLMGEIYGNPQATQKMLDDAFFNVEAWINSELATEFAEGRLPLPQAMALRSRKGSWRMNPLMKPIRSGRSANFSILYPAMRLR
ncbi:major capsid protein [Escherichia coli]|uniref:phage major capsid protein n=1 Tax=Escherichia coli TaxID=562 RepID=UPI000DFA0071|nr:major capsid protein [Escherichia coli]